MSEQRLEYRRERRQRFYEYFEKKVPLGIIEPHSLAKECKVPWRTALAYLRELHRAGQVDYQRYYEYHYRYHCDVTVWMRIK